MDGSSDVPDAPGETPPEVTTDPGLWPVLMVRAQTGDQQAYRQLLGSLLPPLRALVRRRVFDETLAEDVVQDTLLTLHRVRHTYDPNQSLLPWIAAIASMRAVDGLRRQGRIQRRELWDEVAMAAELDPDATNRMEGFAATREVGRLLSQLPARQREAVELVKLQQMSLSNAAKITGQSVAALKSLLHRAFIRLRQNGIGRYD